jgi:hypothetical protein
MSVTYKIENPIFKAKDLYAMVRLSRIEYFPYPAHMIEADEVLTIFINKTQTPDFTIKYIPTSSRLAFSGKSHEMYKDAEKKEDGEFHSTVWYISQLSKWNRHNLDELQVDLNQMTSWLAANDYLKNNLPTDKFLKQENLEITNTK